MIMTENVDKKWVPQTDEEIVKAMKIRGEEDLFFFVKEICRFGYNPDPNGPRVTEDQRELCGFIQETLESENPDDWLSLILASRDTLKTTCLLGAALWVLVKNPNYRILLYGEVHDQTQKRLLVIKNVIDTCKTFRRCYGDLNGSNKNFTWNREAITLATKTQHAAKEANIETAGLDVVVNQLHFDLVLPDDLHSDKNITSKEMIENVKSKVKLLIPLVSKGAKMMFAGVFWDDSDLHTWLMEEQKPKLFKKGAYVDEAQTISAYPHTLPVEDLKRKRRFMENDKFSCHYLLDPISKETQKFHKEFFTIIPKNMSDISRVFIDVDPAGDPTSENANRKDSDFTGMTVTGITSAHDLILLDGYMGKVSPTEAVEYAILFILKYKPFIIGVERAAIGNMAFYLKEELRKRGLFAIVEDNLPKGRSKYQRIMELEPFARTRKIFIAEDCPIKDQFINQITRFPKAKHDDLPDPFAYMMDHLRDYGYGLDEDSEDKIPTALLALNETSRQFHLAERRKKDRAANQNWLTEFV